MSKPIRTARTSLVIIAAICAIVLLYSSIIQGWAMAPPSPTDLAVALHRVSLDPESLTAAGLSPTEADEIVGEVQTHMTATPGALDAADAGCASSKIAYNDMLRTIRAGIASEQEVGSLPGLASDLATDESTRDAMLNDIFETTIALEFTNPQQTALENIRANRHWKLPVEYLVVNRSEQEWVDLRDALAHERICEETGEEVDPEIAAFLAQVRSDAAVSGAMASLSTGLALVTSAWEDAVNPQ